MTMGYRSFCNYLSNYELLIAITSNRKYSFYSLKSHEMDNIIWINWIRKTWQYNIVMRTYVSRLIHVEHFQTTSLFIFETSPVYSIGPFVKLIFNLFEMWSAVHWAIRRRNSGKLFHWTYPWWDFNWIMRLWGWDL